ncbi:MAG: hypothetical protein ACLGPM_03125 [Acidobacteriota bacterium]
MREIPRELDWVKERAACTLERMFALLHESVTEDIKRINTIRKFPESDGFEISPSNDGKAFTVKRAQAIKPVVIFSIESDCISVTGLEGATQEYRISLCDDGRCKLIEHGVPLEQWQVRRAALEALFFRS